MNIFGIVGTIANGVANVTYSVGSGTINLGVTALNSGYSAIKSVCKKEKHNNDSIQLEGSVVEKLRCDDLLQSNNKTTQLQNKHMNFENVVSEINTNTHHMTLRSKRKTSGYSR